MLTAIASFLCLTVLTVVRSSPAECQSRIISCPCGTSNTTVQIRLNCDDQRISKDPCAAFENCETCQNWFEICLTCPTGKSGASCNEKIGFPAENVIRNRRQSQQCPSLQSPKPGLVRCLYDSDKVECTGTCSPGHTFPDGEREKIFRCNYNSRRWSPQSSFPQCKSSGECDLKLKGAGGYNCSINNQGTFCDIQCSSFPSVSGRFFCYPGQDWSPRLPHCAEKKGVTSIPQRCNCQNGGSCDPSTLTCRCLPNYQGRLCEGRIEVTNPPPRCSCQNGGTCDPVTLRCNCPSGYRGRRCQNKIVTSPPPRCHCQNGGTCDPTTLKCRCPPDYEGRQCQNKIEPPDVEYCDNPGNIANGDGVVVPLLNERRRRPLRDDTQEFPEGTKLVFSCRDGYTLRGESTVRCSSGDWIPEEMPSCTASRTEELEYCDNPGRIRHGNREVVPHLNERNKPLPDDAPDFPEGTKLVFECDEGYVIQGENTLRCESGYWTPEDPPICTASTAEGRNPEQSTYCNDPGDPENGHRYLLAEPVPKFRNSSAHRRYAEGTQFVFYCDEHYVIKGDDLVTCRKSGFWSSPLPVCNYESGGLTDLKYCDNPGNIANGDREVISRLDERGKPVSDDPPEFPEGTKLIYSCRNGYTLQGEEILRCVSGFWSPGRKPSCTASRTSQGGEECGLTAISIRRKITQGDRTEEGEWPWHVGIAVPDSNGWKIKCGGVLISKTAVLTAAHCLPSRPRDILLYLGKYYRSIDDSDGEEVQVKTPNRLIFHPRYNISAPLDSDIAVIRFSPPAIFTDRVRPICLPDAATTRSNLTPGNRGWVTGWGLTEKRLTSDVLLKGRLPVVSNNQCREAYRQLRLSIVITNNMFCAGYEEGGMDSCEGDSGGPFMFASDPDKSYVLEGLVSFGSAAGCGQPRHYSVYTKVGNYVDWIEENI